MLDDLVRDDGLGDLVPTGEAEIGLGALENGGFVEGDIDGLW